MNDIASVFDVHERITYEDLTHLYWGAYPFRVTVEARPRLSLRWMKSDQNLSYADVRDMMTDLLEELKFTDPKGTHCRRKTSTGFNFFFETQEEAARFIDDNVFFVSTVVRPKAQSHLDYLCDNEEHCEVEIREQLFWNRYRFCVHLKSPKTDDDEDIFDYRQRCLGGDRDRSMLNCSGNDHKLYLRDRNDVIATKLALGMLVVGVTKAVLHGDLA